MAITPEQILQTADTLVEHGQPPTLAAIRASLGGGSFTTISEAMKVWRARKDAARQAHIVPPPAALQEQVSQAGTDLVKQVWQQAQAAAEARLESERAALAEARAVLEAEARQAAEITDQLETQLERMTAERDAGTGRIGQVTTERDQIRWERDDARRQAETLSARREELTRERDQARQEAKDAITRAAALDGRLQSEQERRQQAEAAVEQIRAQASTAETLLTARLAAADARLAATTEALARAEQRAERLETRVMRAGQASTGATAEQVNWLEAAPAKGDQAGANTAEMQPPEPEAKPGPKWKQASRKPKKRQQVAAAEAE